MKLIDILNLIAKGELEEGTKIKRLRSDTVWVFKVENGYNRLDDEDGMCYLDCVYCINDEVELIEPTHQIGESDKKLEIGHDTNVATKIEELTWEEAHGENGFNMTILNKLNEVIRELNRRSKQ